MKKGGNSMEREFEIIGLGLQEKGLLKTFGNREVVISVKVLPGADNSDNEWIMESIRNLYLQYYTRVSEYRNMGDK